MVTASQIEEWIHEIEERPASAGTILRSVAARLVELEKWNEELLSDNIALRSGNRVEEFESRIAALEYQLELLKRHSGAEGVFPERSASGPEAPFGLLFYNTGGQLLRLPVRPRPV